VARHQVSIRLFAGNSLVHRGFDKLSPIVDSDDEASASPKGPEHTVSERERPGPFLPEFHLAQGFTVLRERLFSRTLSVIGFISLSH
jgi:hypothetical protein